MSVPLSNAEPASPDACGSLVALRQLAITFGIGISFWIDYGTNYIGGDDTWVFSFLGGLFICLVLRGHFYAMLIFKFSRSPSRRASPLKRWTKHLVTAFADRQRQNDIADRIGLSAYNQGKPLPGRPSSGCTSNGVDVCKCSTILASRTTFPGPLHKYRNDQLLYLPATQPARDTQVPHFYLLPRMPSSDPNIPERDVKHPCCSQRVRSRHLYCLKP